MFKFPTSTSEDTPSLITYHHSPHLPFHLRITNITSTNLHRSRTQDTDHRVSLNTLIFSRFAKSELVYIC
ncbi:hypothetical protein HanPI659440_Chr09g0350431 [Helianthus annuus]|nr:hypothetical protein HanPI659440_Chr09g0350431 [Helianthus annuus]